MTYNMEVEIIDYCDVISRCLNGEWFRIDSNAPRKWIQYSAEAYRAEY